MLKIYYRCSGCLDMKENNNEKYCNKCGYVVFELRVPL